MQNKIILDFRHYSIDKLIVIFKNVFIDILKLSDSQNTVILIHHYNMKRLIGFISIVTCTLHVIHGMVHHVETTLNTGTVQVIYY